MSPLVTCAANSVWMCTDEAQDKQNKQTNKFYFMSVFVTKYIRLLMLKTLAAMAIITDHTPVILIN